MQEDFLHFVWKYKRFDFKNLKTTEGDPVKVLQPGQHNHDSGPDFFQSKIKIGETLWVGNTEIHINSSDWNKHQHQHDTAYNNVVLHVVHEHDTDIRNQDELKIPTVELKGRIPQEIIRDYEQIVQSKKSIPCANMIHEVDGFVVDHWIDRLVIQRLEHKSERIETMLEAVHQDWQEAFYRQIAYAFGLKVNAEAFLALTEQLPLKVLGKHKSSLFQIEALLYGQAGMLNHEFSDDYPNELKREYNFLRKKFSLTPIAENHWKFMRLRPPSFPTIRLALFARLIYNSQSLFSKLLETDNPDEIFHIFDLQASEYWQTHYKFDKASKKRRKTLGETAINNIIINTVVPFLFVYGKNKKQQQYVDKGLTLLEATKAEKNSLIDRWNKLGIHAENAYKTQGLIELTNTLCNEKKCLNCSIGIELLKQKLE